MAEYVNPGGGSFSKTQGAKNPFLIAQAVSSSPIDPANSPMKDFGIVSVPLAIAAAAKAAAATKVGAAVVGGVKALGSKLAATKLGGAVVKGAKFVGKGIKALKGTKVGKAVTKGVDAINKSVKKFTGKLKPKVGAKGAKTGADATTSASESATQTADVTKTVDATKTSADVAKTSKTSSTTAKADATASVPKEKSWLFKQLSTEKIANKAKEQSDKDDAKGKGVESELLAKSSQSFAGMQQDFGGQQSHVPQEELGSVLTFKRALPKPIPLRLRAKNAFSPFKGKKSKMKYDEAKAGMGFGATWRDKQKSNFGELGAEKSSQQTSLESMSVIDPK